MASVNSRVKKGLALSGGGFRATLFHLGVIGFLRDMEKANPRTKALSGITHITSVSGGSVIAAHLVLNWEKYIGSNDDFNEVASQIVTIAKKDIRGRILRRIPVNAPLYALSILFQKVGFLEDKWLDRRTQVSTTDLLEKFYARHLFKKATLRDLGSLGRPKLYLLATNLDDAEQASFTSTGIEVSGAANLHSRNYEKLSRAVAASSAFPGMFPPVTQKVDNHPNGLRFLDGGVYDNLGVRRFKALLEIENVKLKNVIVSDASAKFKPVTRRGAFEPVTAPFRAADILFRRVYKFDKADAIRIDAAFPCDFKFLALSDNLDPADDDLALDLDYQLSLNSIRTDLDAFTDLEVTALVRHGYCVAREKLQPKRRGRAAQTTPPPWDPVPKTKCRLAKAIVSRESHPHGRKIKRALLASQNRKLRLHGWGDLMSYGNILCILLLILAIQAGPTGYLYFFPNIGTDDQIRKSRDDYGNLLMSRLVTSGDWTGVLATNVTSASAPLKTDDRNTWGTSQAIYALLKSGPIASDKMDLIIASVDSNYLSAAEGGAGDYDPETGGWFTRSSDHKLQAEPALWTMAAICVLLQREDSELKGARPRLIERLDKIHKYLVDEKIIWTKPFIGFNVLANQADKNNNNLYTTSLGLLALIELKRAHLKFVAQSPDGLIGDILERLNATYRSEAPTGWGSLGFEQSEAVTLQILAISLEAYNELRAPIPMEFKDRLEEHMFALDTLDPGEADGRGDVVVVGPDGITRPYEVRITFLGRPWALRLCRSWLRILSMSSTPGKKDEVLRITGKLVKKLPDAVKQQEKELTFRSAEMLIALS